ncbi:ABC transporter permease [Xanthovirga aplysinae]|uniref:ABC transporter permease n=1 Tax=Xanthovirga aplysinae TaxID=2529853 RepID=UPI0012BC2E09|nr:ABC transporter permease [Xanthovirga aplysinae]MTI31749.1 ABC transporter permease [Xanthovirga aplysinae]
MLRSNILPFLRHIKQSKTSFIIHLIGLSTGLACALLVFLWVKDELGIDKFHEKDDRLFQVMARFETPSGIEVSPVMPPILAQTLLDEIPEIEYAISEGVIPNDSKLIVGKKAFTTRGVFADKDYFNVFSYELIQGDINQVLSDESNIVISEELAQKAFNTGENLIGKLMDYEQFGHKHQVRIAGVFKIPPQSSKQFDFILPFGLTFKVNPNFTNSWKNSWPSTYITLKEGTKLAHLDTKMTDVVRKRANYEEADYFLKQYSKGYLKGKYENGVQAGGRIEYVKLFSVIAIFILIIACINFMNLSTAKAPKRMREIGVKKTLGASRKSLIFQFLGESVLMALISLIFATIIVFELLPQFNEISGKNLTLGAGIDLLPTFLLIAVLTGLIAGSYPALYLSGFKPLMALKGKFVTSTLNFWTRNGLIVFQFILSVSLIFGVLVIYKQMELVQNKNMGYNKDHIIYFEMDGKIKEHLDVFLLGANEVPGVKNASSMWLTFFGDLNSTGGLYWEGKDPNSNLSMQYRRVNYEMLELLGIQMKEGRTFSREFSAEQPKIIFNETAIEKMGITDPIGKNVKLWGKGHETLGVAKDFYFESLHEAVKPLFILLLPQRTNTIMVKMDSERTGETIDSFEQYYSSFTQGQALEFKFLDDVYQAQYLAEKRVAVLSKYFAGLAIVISCLGLFGLMAFIIEKRKKEIGIRKALGANNFSIIYNLSTDFNKLVLISLTIALPLSYVLAKEWLENFVLRIDLNLWYFLVAGLCALLLTWCTLGFQAIKIWKANIVESLRTNE